MNGKIGQFVDYQKIMAKPGTLSLTFLLREQRTLKALHPNELVWEGK
jgi:hypothetical protein